MAYLTTSCIIKPDNDIYGYFDQLSRKSKLLYNAALFRIRNIFTGYDKEHRTENEKAVFDEVNLLCQKDPSVKVRRVISYYHLEKMLKVTDNSDYRHRGLPTHVAQHVVKQAVADFNNWLAALKGFKSTLKIIQVNPVCHITRRVSLQHLKQLIRKLCCIAMITKLNLRCLSQRRGFLFQIFQMTAF